MKISVIIPVYKNKELFLKNLKYNDSFLSDMEVIIVDDDSNENLEKDIRKQFKSIKILINKKNIGFAGSVNRAVKLTHGEFIFLLNSDVKLKKINFEKSISDLKRDQKIFAVTFLQEERDGQIVGKNVIFFKRGLIGHKKSKNLKKGLTAWAEGGSSLIRKKYFEELGGFDEIYAPFYWEDIDLSYRAYGRGWKVIFDPEIVVQHYHESTIGKFYAKNFIRTIAYRNQFIFTWKNLIDRDKIFLHILLLPYHFFMALIRVDTQYIRGFIYALTRFKKILNKRKLEGRERKKTDLDIFELLKE